jgi:hypothetical protein
MVASIGVILGTSVGGGSDGVVGLLLAERRWRKGTLAVRERGAAVVSEALLAASSGSLMAMEMGIEPQVSGVPVPW